MNDDKYGGIGFDEISYAIWTILIISLILFAYACFKA